MATRIQFRRSLSGEWTAGNPILAQGELAIELDTSRFKIGDGIEAWNDLPYGGIDGEQGEQGVKGDQGDQGIQGIKGDTGAQGIQGETGATGANGATGIEWQGTWDNTADYVDNDAVYYNGTSWFASGDPTVGEEPTDSAANWFPLAIQGATGSQGIQGIQGIQGEQGIQGDQGIQGETGTFDGTVIDGGNA